MVHVFEHPKLSVGPLCVNGTLERPGQLLDRDLVERALVKERVVGAAHLTVGPASDGGQVGVPMRHLPHRLVQLDRVITFLHLQDLDSNNETTTL